ncbi:2-isopropylmalate synthase [Pelomyxa schiedti]|nr:2-isopropylmalate synthase [Pelomyxa schiedti]
MTPTPTAAATTANIITTKAAPAPSTTNNGEGKDGTPPTTTTDSATTKAARPSTTSKVVGYNGETKDGVRHGRGFLRCADGYTYEGEWHNGERDGWGVCHWGNGDWFEGLFRGGHRKRGEDHSKNGVLDGEWVRNGTNTSSQMQGWGVQRAVRTRDSVATMETVYEGGWEGSKWHGSGTWHSPDHGDIYHGQFDHGKRSGTGRMLLRHPGGSLVGCFKNDMFHGRGVRIWEDGTRYEGDWVSGKENGAGTKTWASDGTSIAGVWEMGVIKSGTKRWPNGDEFTGTFTMHGHWGEGTATFRCGGPSSSNTITLVGTFKENDFQETKCGGGRGMCCHIGYGDIQLEEKTRILERELKELEAKVEQQSKEKQEALLKSTKTCEDLQKKINDQTEYFQIRCKEFEQQKTMTDIQIKELNNKLKSMSKEKEETLLEIKRTREALEVLQNKFEEQTELMGLQTKQFMDQEEYFEHTLQHLQKGMWVKTSCPENTNNKCVMKTLSVTLERHNITFRECFCTRCPLDKIVKMEVEKRFGVDENQQVTFLDVVLSSPTIHCIAIIRKRGRRGSKQHSSGTSEGEDETSDDNHGV